MSASAFIDTNIIVYLFDSRSAHKQSAAAELLQRLADDETSVVISTQVLQEAYAALTRKLRMDPGEALAALQMMEAAAFQVHPVDTALVWRGAQRSVDNGLSFWDALIVEAAIEAGCATLYSEDLQSGRRIDDLVVVNPFIRSPAS